MAFNQQEEEHEEALNNDKQNYAIMENQLEESKLQLISLREECDRLHAEAHLREKHIANVENMLTMMRWNLEGLLTTTKDIGAELPKKLCLWNNHTSFSTK